MKWHFISPWFALLMLGGMTIGCSGNSAQKAIMARERGDTSSTDALINEKSFNVNAANRHGITPLLQALFIPLTVPGETFGFHGDVKWGRE